MAVAAALHVAGNTGHESRRVRPHCHAGFECLANQVFPGMARIKGEARDCDAEEQGRLAGARQALGLRHEIDHEAQHRRRSVGRKAADAVAADLDQPGQRRMGPGDQAAVARLEPDAVVADEAGVAALKAGDGAVAASRRRLLPRRGAVLGPAHPHRARSDGAMQPMNPIREVVS